MKMLPLDGVLALQGFKVQDGALFTCGGLGLRNLLTAGTRWLEIHVNVVNNLNVFPVPDGDTGTNMVLTMRAALQEIEKAADHSVGAIATAAAHGALLGARGNSGVILAEFLQGLGIGLQTKDVFTATDFANAFQLGVNRAYLGVVDPVEGTILTVARAAAEAARQGAESNQDLELVLSNMVSAAQEAQANTPQLLPILQEAGVTDSGGQGLLYILEGALRYVVHESLELEPVDDRLPTLLSTLGVDDHAYGYDVQFLIQGERLDVNEIRAYIDTLGQSTVVVGDEHIVKVHVHAADPGLPLSYASSLGIVCDVVVENMTEQARAFVHQHHARSVRTSMSGDLVTGGAAPNIAIVSVAMGQGLIDIFRSLGVNHIIRGGQGKNPSTQEIVAAVEQVPADNVLILPNNSNIILTAQQAQMLSTKQVEIIPTRTVPQGISAMLRFSGYEDVERNSRRMVGAIKQVRTIEIMTAVRAVNSKNLFFAPGDKVGLLDSEVVAAGQEPNKVAIDVLSQLNTDGCDVMTIYFGQECVHSQADALASQLERLYPEIEVELHNGGQPDYHYIISLE